MRCGVVGAGPWRLVGEVRMSFDAGAREARNEAVWDRDEENARVPEGEGDMLGEGALYSSSSSTSFARASSIAASRAALSPPVSGRSTSKYSSSSSTK